MDDIQYHTIVETHKWRQCAAWVSTQVISWKADEVNEIRNMNVFQPSHVWVASV